MKLIRALTASLALTVPVVALATTATGLASAGAATGPDAAVVVASEQAAVHPASALVPSGFYWQLTTPQEVLPGSVLVAREDLHRRSHGTRSDDQFFAISSTGDNDVPDAALRAYRHAAQVMATTDPGCHISWTLLAAIGRVESDHGRFGGAQLGSDGVSRPEIRGPQLDGTGAFAAIKDTDGGRLDRDPVWDRAVGQMQFLPGTWAAVGRDGDGDGRRDPDDIDDSALGSAVYLCGAGGSLADAAGMARAAFRYNHSDYYVSLVLSFQAGYTTGVFALPSPPPSEGPARRTTTDAATKQVAPTTKPKKAKPTTKVPATPRHPGKPTPTPPAATPAPVATPTPKPAPKLTPKPTPTAPPAPQLVTVTGTWAACGTGFCLDGTPLDLGTPLVRGSRASVDLDGDGTVETNAGEFTGLVGRTVTLQVTRGATGTVVYVVGGHGFRNADGSFARPVVAEGSLAREAVSAPTP